MQINRGTMDGTTIWLIRIGDRLASSSNSIALLFCQRQIYVC